MSMPVKYIQEITQRLSIIADPKKGADPDAGKLLKKLLWYAVLLTPKDFWIKLYDWSREAYQFLSERKIPITLQKEAFMEVSH